MVFQNAQKARVTGSMAEFVKDGAGFSDDDFGDEPSTSLMGSGHLDSPMERRAAKERAEMGKKNATGALFKGGVGRANERDNVKEVVVDKDGDGTISLLEKFDKDGDGKISMLEYAKTTDQQVGTAGGIAEQFAADSVGVSAAERQAWSTMRAEQKAGHYNKMIAERVRESGEKALVYRPELGGWTGGAATPPSPVGNRNVASNPFESRIFGGLTKYQQGHASHAGTHYAVADRSDETYAYSGARGIFKKVDAASYIPAHYQRDAASGMSNSGMYPPGDSPRLPGTDQPHRGGWPVQKTVGPKVMPSDHVGGFSLEKSTGPRTDHNLFTQVGPSR